ncbi:MAG: rane protein, partial [Paenibacillus sp.]|nr:rane protein [Paenibacillus sp.]
GGMVLWGAFVNAVAIVAGSFAGLFLPRLRDDLRRTVTQGIGLALCVLGLMMAMKTEQYLALVISLVLGGIAGELIRLEDRLERLGDWLERKVSAKGDGKVGKAFVTATLVYCIGAMAILGSIDSGIRHDHQILYAKSLMDGFLSIIFASALGLGVAFSAVPVFVYQGAIALGAAVLASLFSTETISMITREVSAVGGVLIIGVGINLLDLKKIHVANMLPAVVVMAVIMAVLNGLWG